MIKNFILSILALMLSGALIVSIPLLNYLMHGGLKKKQQKIIPNVEIKKVTLQKREKKPRKKLHRPQRKRPVRTRLKSGPRFAMDLSVAGGEGVEVELDLVNKARGQGVEKGDVDEKPAPNFPPPFRLPRQVKNSEINAITVLAFCVDEAGRAFDIQIVEENPPGLGMAEAGQEALRQTSFQPARKEGNPVPFCGLEQPFEVKFDD